MLQVSIDWFLYQILGLDGQSKIVGSLNYFIYDSIKILLLLWLMILAIGFLRTYLPQEKVKSWLSQKIPGLSNLLASVFGAITPFCSCSSIPIFISFLRAGVPLGVNFSFLITSPIVNEYLFVLMWGFFGWKIAVAYVISGILVGVFSGLVLGRMRLEKYLEKDLLNSHSKEVLHGKNFAYFSARLKTGFQEANALLKKLWLWILMGVAVGALIHNFIPEDFVHQIMSSAGIFTVPLAALIGIPFYGSCAAIVPIAVALFQKGVNLGTALSFMMAVSALSLPEAIILRRAMKLKLILIFFGVVAVAIIFTGYLFNFLQGILV